MFLTRGFVLAMAVIAGGLTTAISSVQAQTTALAAGGKPLSLVVLGDSLSAGYGLPADAAFPAVLERALKARGHVITIINAGVSGDTMTGGLNRLDWSVGAGVDGVILELGANDGLRGIDPAITDKALNAILDRLEARKIPVMLSGMLAPPNYGEDYANHFNGMYKKAAVARGLILDPFFLAGVAGNSQLNLPDGIHPTAEGVRLIVQRILPTIETFIASIKR